MGTEPYRGLATTFDGVAELYERVRPGYPAELFEDLRATVDPTGAGARVLEVGAGTGQATRGLLALRWSVVALEPGAGLAAVARRVLAGSGDVRVEQVPFERWQPAGDRFDLVLAATSWHWVDPVVGFARAARALRPGGWLAVIATEHVSPVGDGDEFFRLVEAAYDEVGLGDGQGGPRPPEQVPAPDVEAIRASGFFADPEVRRYVRGIDYTADEYVALISSYSGHIAATPRQRDTLFARIRGMIADRPGQRVRKHYLTTLQLAVRPPEGAGPPARTA